MEVGEYHALDLQSDLSAARLGSLQIVPSEAFEFMPEVNWEDFTCEYVARRHLHHPNLVKTTKGPVAHKPRKAPETPNQV